MQALSVNSSLTRWPFKAFFFWSANFSETSEAIACLFQKSPVMLIPHGNSSEMLRGGNKDGVFDVNIHALAHNSCYVCLVYVAQIHIYCVGHNSNSIF